MNDQAPPKSARVLFLAQLPPPVHGVTTISAGVFAAFEAQPHLQVTRMWSGSAAAITQVGRFSWSKLGAFGRFVARLGKLIATGQRFDATYQTFVPHGDAALRDAIVLALSKCLARRALVHLHTRGLDDCTRGDGLRARFMRFVLKGSELIAVSGGVASQARATGLFARVHQLENFVARPDARVRPDVERPEMQRRGAGLRCGWLGNYDPRKGVIRFIDVIDAMQSRGIDVTGRIAGGDTKALSRADLENELAARNLGDTIRIQSFLDGPAKSAWFADLDAFVYPTRHDLAPLVVLEALSHGVVPIVFDTGALREMMGPDLADFVIDANQQSNAHASDDTGALSQMVSMATRLAADRTALESAKAAARHRFKTCFTEQRFHQRIAEIITDRGHTEPQPDVVAARHAPVA